MIGGGLRKQAFECVWAGARTPLGCSSFFSLFSPTTAPFHLKCLWLSLLLLLSFLLTCFLPCSCILTSRKCHTKEMGRPPKVIADVHHLCCQHLQALVQTSKNYVFSVAKAVSHLHRSLQKVSSKSKLHQHLCPTKFRPFINASITSQSS